MSDDRDEEWANLGRSFAQDELQERADQILCAFQTAAKAVREDRLTGDEIEDCYAALDAAEIVVDELAEIPEGYDRPKRAVELLDQDELQELFLD